MVKGISRQVIVVHSPDPKVFEQAIFIVREDAKDITDDTDRQQQPFWKFLIKQADPDYPPVHVRPENGGPDRDRE